MKWGNNNKKNSISSEEHPESILKDNSVLVQLYATVACDGRRGTGSLWALPLGLNVWGLHEHLHANITIAAGLSERVVDLSLLYVAFLGILPSVLLS